MIVTPRLALVATALGLVLAVAVAYHNSLGGPFVFDDRVAIFDNSTIRQLWPIAEALSPPSGGQSDSDRPLVNLSMAINYRLGGTDPRGYHVCNVLVHTLAALTLFGIVRRTWRSRDGQPGEAGLFIAGGIALLWALHPLQTAAVTYVVQRAESMMGLFYLLTLYCLVRAVGLNPPSAAAVDEGAGMRDSGDGSGRRPCLPKNGDCNPAGTEARRGYEATVARGLDHLVPFRNGDQGGNGDGPASRVVV